MAYRHLPQQTYLQSGVGPGWSKRMWKYPGARSTQPGSLVENMHPKKDRCFEFFVWEFLETWFFWEGLVFFWSFGRFVGFFAGRRSVGFLFIFGDFSYHFWRLPSSAFPDPTGKAHLFGSSVLFFCSPRKAQEVVHRSQPVNLAQISIFHQLHCHHSVQYDEPHRGCCTGCVR